MSPTAPQHRRNFKVAIICALPLEAESVRSVFDRCWEDENIYYNKAEGDQNTYTTGVIGRYNVVLAHMPGMGSVSASAVAQGLRSSFPGIQLALVVGICGVIPMHPRTKEEIVLGDVVISTAVVQYDFGRQYPTGFERKKSVEDSLSRASPEIRSFVSMLQVRQNRQRLTRNLAQLVCSEHFQTEIPDAKYPGATRDRLFKATYLHQHRPLVSCHECYNNMNTCSKSCDEVGCEKDQVVARNRHGVQDTGETLAAIESTPSIHLGRFGSANMVMKSGLDRDRLAAADEIIAFEMEGAGVWEQLPTIVIKAACDYADSHKDKDWQKYAAAMAAACLNVFLKEWFVPDLEESPVPIWHVPFDIVPGFVGRAAELERLEKTLYRSNGRRIASVSGLGGIGKSRLALEFAYLMKKKHPQQSILWIQAADQLTFEKDILEIGKKLGIPEIEDSKADIKTLVREWLSNQAERTWILILDSADDEMLWGRRSDPDNVELSLANYLPMTTNCSILVTTRSIRVATFLTGADVVNLDALSLDEAVEVFMNRLGSSPHLAADREALSTLLAKLTYLPLAIVQASAYVSETQHSVQTYLKLLDASEISLIKLLSKDFEDATRYPNAINPVTTTWLISFQRIQRFKPLAANFLSSMACLHEKSIPLSFLLEASTDIDDIDIIDNFSVLTRYAFIRQISDSTIHGEEMYDMHRLVQLAARSWLKNQGLFLKTAMACTVRLAQQFPTRDHENKSIWTAYFPHARRLCDTMGLEELPERYQLLEKMGLCYIREGKYHDAVTAHAAVVKWREHTFGSTEEQTLNAYNNIGEALNWAGDWPAAEKYLQQAFKGRKESLGTEDPDSLASMANLASTYWNQGRWTQAEELQVQVMETRKRVIGPEHPDTLTSISNLASMLWNQGRWTQAEELQVQVMETRKRVLGPEHPGTLTSIANLASTYWDQGRWTQAEELQVQVMETRKRVIGPEHPDTLTSISNLASMLWNQGRWTQAEELQVQVMETTSRVIGPEHPNTLTSMNNYAHTLKRLNRVEDAVKLMYSCTELSMKVLGPSHHQTQSSLLTLLEWLGGGDVAIEERQTTSRMPGAWPDTIGRSTV